MRWVYVPKSWNNIHAMSDFRLKVFCCVARNLSYTKAAQELFISQPAVTKHVKELETHYQIRLFERLGSRIELTHAGRLLLDHCEAILEAYNRLEFEMNLLRNEYSGELRLGASTTIAQYVLPPLLAQFIEKFPHITVSMFNGNSREVEVALQEHRIDLALLEGSSRLPSLKYAHFLDDELVMVMRTKSRLAVAEEISLDELQRLPLVLREIGSGTLDVIEKALAAHNIRLSALNVLLYLGGTESIKHFLECTDCLGIVSIRSISNELATGKLRVIEIKDLTMNREFCFARLQGQDGGLPSIFMNFALHERKNL